MKDKFSAVQILENTIGQTLWFKDCAGVLTMDVVANQVEDWSNHSVMAAKKNVDLIVEDGKISYIGPSVDRVFKNEVTEIDARKLVLMPGLVDAHTHPVFVGSRAKETVQKAMGLSYEEIAKSGGGIAVTTASTRMATNEELQFQLKRHWQTALSRGVVLMESKTGYGLSPAEEMRHLEVLCKSTFDHAHMPLPFVAPTLLGPHAASPDFLGLDHYLQALIEQLPKIKSVCVHSMRTQPLAADIFIERDYFTSEHGEKWLGAALQLGLDVHIHGDEFSRSGGSELAIALATQKEQSAAARRLNGRVLSVDHGQYATETDLAKLRRFGIAAVALPATSFFSKIPYVDAKKWRSSGVRVAIASDFNPGSAPLNSLWFSAFLGLKECGFSVSEVLAGITLNAAYALGAEESFGTLQVGKPGHLIAFEGEAAEDFFASPVGDHLRYVVLGE